MKYLMVIICGSIFLTACGGTTVNVTQVTETKTEQETTQATNNENTTQQATGETAVVSKNESVATEKIVGKTLRNVDLDYYSVSEIKNIVDYTIRPASQKIQNAINNKQIKPVDASLTDTSYQLDNVYITIVDDGYTRYEYTYLDGKLIFLLTLVDGQITGRYYFYDGVFIRYLDEFKNEINRPYFSDSIIRNAQYQVDLY